MSVLLYKGQRRVLKTWHCNCFKGYGDAKIGDMRLKASHDIVFKHGSLINQNT